MQRCVARDGRGGSPSRDAVDTVKGSFDFGGIPSFNTEAQECTSVETGPEEGLTEQRRSRGSRNQTA